MLAVYVDNCCVVLPKNSTCMQACEVAGVHIPRFCYHVGLSIAGNCRICLVEISKSPKPQPSCTLPIISKIRVYTQSPLVRKAREAVIEFLLINHPLDCPICDQGGQCDLQDQSLMYGSDRSRFYEYKRGVEDKFIGNFVKTVITRCIHCTRCVRFTQEIDGNGKLGSTNRGQNIEIGTYVETAVSWEVSGNLIDLCPVGALTSKVQAFKSRVWEVDKSYSVDVFDGIGSPLIIEVKDAEVIRILPSNLETTKHNWITDKARFSYDGIHRQRLGTPFVLSKGNLCETSWIEALSLASMYFESSWKVKLCVHPSTEMETLYEIKSLSSLMGGSQFVDLQNKSNTEFSNYSLDLKESGDLCILFGMNPRLEANMLHLNLISDENKGISRVGSFGGYKSNLWIGFQIQHLTSLAQGVLSCCQLLCQAKRPHYFYSNTSLRRKDGESILGIVQYLSNLRLQNTWQGLSYVSTEANEVGCASLGLPKWIGKSNLNVDNNEVCYSLGVSVSHPNLVYQGHHLDETIISYKPRVILPGITFAEKSGTYINAEGRFRYAEGGLTSLGNSKVDSDILKYIRIYSIKHQSNWFVNLVTKFVKDKNIDENKNFNLRPWHLVPSLKNLSHQSKSELAMKLHSKPVNMYKVWNTGFKSVKRDFYLSHSICKASSWMLKASLSRRKQFHGFSVVSC